MITGQVPTIILNYPHNLHLFSNTIFQLGDVVHGLYLDQFDINRIQKVQ